MRFFQILISKFLTHVPSKSIPKTPYELWLQKKTSLQHFHFLGYKVEVRPYNLQSNKFDPKTTSKYLIGYCVRSRGSRFYCLSYTIRVIESNRAIYLRMILVQAKGNEKLCSKNTQFLSLFLLLSL